MSERAERVYNAYTQAYCWYQFTGFDGYGWSAYVCGVRCRTGVLIDKRYLITP